MILEESKKIILLGNELIGRMNIKIQQRAWSSSRIMLSLKLIFLKRMADELGTQLEGVESIKATTEFLSKMSEEYKSI